VPAGNTYEAIFTTTLLSDNSVSFSSIPQTYTDLVVVFNGKGTTGTTGYNNLTFTFNSDSSSLYSRTRVQGDGSSANAATDGSLARHDIFVSNNGENFSTSIINIMNYSNTTTFKTAVWRDSLVVTGGLVVGWAGLYRSTSAITSIQFTNTYKTGSTFSLYGIKAA
jgi:hypothetical protein